MELTSVFLINKRPMHKSGKIVSAPLMKITPKSCTDLSLLAFPLTQGTVLYPLCPQTYLSLEGLMAFLRRSSAHWHQEFVPKPRHGSVIEEFQIELKLYLSSPLDHSLQGGGFLAVNPDGKPDRLEPRTQY